MFCVHASPFTPFEILPSTGIPVLPCRNGSLACTTASRANGTRWSNVAEHTSRSYARPAAGGTITPGDELLEAMREAAGTSGTWARLAGIDKGEARSAEFAIAATPDDQFEPEPLLKAG